MAAKLLFNCTNKMDEYEACILVLKMAIDMNVYELLVIGGFRPFNSSSSRRVGCKESKDYTLRKVPAEVVQKICLIEFRHTPRIQNELDDALATIASTIKHPDTDYIDPLDKELKEHPVHCSHVEAEPDGLPWFFDIKKYLESGTYPEDATSNQKKSVRRMTLNFFLSGEVFYRRTPDLGLQDALMPSKLRGLLNRYMPEFVARI
ncbi:uncharacterized protein [Solanum lycopersicum]|uniref:uncharacterized protein n=1 Tax=Solanum lycopersicum TaxID=4081 RepID=UPI0002BC94C8|nr:uncharacterized protein LOC101252580 [Solanum lycopersicum]